MALELAGAHLDTLTPWVQRVLGGRHRTNIDVVAYHHYARAHEIQDQLYRFAAHHDGNAGGWRWPIWLTEAGPIGCNSTPRAGRDSLGYCTGSEKSYIADGFQAAHVGGVLRAMQAAPSASASAARWQKTFYWHSHAQVVANNEGDNYGILDGARQNQLRGRPAFTSFAGVAGPLLASGATYGYNQSVPVTATPAVASSYYYVWDQRWCYNGNAPGDCGAGWYQYRQGQDLRTVSPTVRRQDFWVEVRAKQYAWRDAQGVLGPQVGETYHRINGAGECTDPRGCGGGPMRMGAGTAAPDWSATNPTPATRPPGVSDLTWERMRGYDPRGRG